MKYNLNKKNGFTLVELLAVIVILAIILVIAVPKVMNVIEDSKKATLESTAKMIASAAEKAKVQNTVLGKTDDITCDSVAKINNLDYANCSIEFDDNNAKVTIAGKGKFVGLWVCGGTKTESIAQSESCPIPYGDGDTYIANLLAKEDELHNGLVQTTVEYNGTQYNAGIRYVGEDYEVNNKVYYNCDDADTNGVSYGENNYDYADSCEIWRMIGVFDTKTSVSGNIEKRVKLINTNSTFKASLDSCEGSSQNFNCSGINCGYGINQWGESTYVDGTPYEGADLMRLLNGYYVGKEGSNCTYCSDGGQEICSKTCTSESLKNKNMKVLTNTAKGMIENVVWDTYGVDENLYPITNSNLNDAYLQEKGISTQYTGKICSETNQDGTANYSCSDAITRTTSWIGLVGLPSLTDQKYAGAWLEWYIRSITPVASDNSASGVWYAYYSGEDVFAAATEYLHNIYPSVYLKPNIKIISGNGDTEPYKLAI